MNVGTATGAATGNVVASGNMVASGGYVQVGSDAAAGATYSMWNGSAAVDNGRWDIATDPTNIYFRALNDAYTVGVSFMTVTRSGTGITAVKFSNSGINVGTATGATSGEVRASGNIFSGGNIYVGNSSGVAIDPMRLDGFTDDFYIVNASTEAGKGKIIFRSRDDSTARVTIDGGLVTLSDTLVVSGNLTGSSWSNATMDGSWSTSASGGSLALSSKKFGDMVFVRGRVRRTGTGQTIGTLVAGHRPSGEIYRTCVSRDGSYSTVLIRVQSSGVITIEPSPGTNPPDIDLSMVFSTNS